MRVYSLVIATFAFALGACSDKPAEEEKPWVLDPATWGRNKTRRDEAKAPGKGELQVGVASGYIDGPVGVSMAGYGGRGGGRRTHWNDALKGSAGFYGMQHIKAVVMSVGDERMAFVKIPLMSSESYLTDAIARHLKRDYDLDFTGRVMTTAPHSHHTTARYWPLPQMLGFVGADSFDVEVAETDAARFAEVIAEAWSNRVPAEWAHTSVENWDPDDEVYRDRRPVNNHLGYGKDPRLTLLAFRRKADKTPLAVVFNFPIHGTVFGSENDLFTEDAPGYVEHKFEEAFFEREGTPVFGLFAQSAGGDASPAGDRLDHPPLARLERIGWAAAPKLLAAYDAIKDWKSETELALRSQRIELVHERMYKDKPWAKEFDNEEGEPYQWGAWQCVPEGDTMEGEPKLCVDLEFLLGMLDVEMPHGAANQVYLTVARLGDLWLVSMPGEPAYSIVQYLREQGHKRQWNGKPAEVMVVGYSQDHLLYLTAPDDWYLGGYESEMSLWGPGGAVFLADEQLGMMDAMIAGNNGPVLFEESPSIDDRVDDWEPRARERSIDAGVIAEEPAETVRRTETARFVVNCGDPGLGSPQLKVQRKDGDTYFDLPAKSGWTGHVYDNSRYEMVSVYDPVPAQEKGRTVAERTHAWRFYWQVPADWPAGTYRFELGCNVLRKEATTAEVEGLVVASRPFVVDAAEDATVLASFDDKAVALVMRVPGVEEKKSNSKPFADGEWVSEGYRLLDPNVRHTERALVRADIQVEFLDEAGEVIETGLAKFDEAKGFSAYTLGASLPDTWTANAWIASDLTPAKMPISLPTR